MSGLLLILSCVPVLVVGLALGRGVKSRCGSLMPRWLPGLALVPGLVPIAWHFRRVSDFIAPLGVGPEPSGAEGELEMLSLSLPFTVVVAWGLMILLTRRLPAAALVFPMFATGLYLFGIAQVAPQVREVIDARTEWLSLLLIAQAPVTAAVAGFLWSALGRSGLLVRWPLRAR